MLTGAFLSVEVSLLSCRFIRILTPLASGLGYLLHGSPGSGKTSLIHAIAGALNLDIYVVSLSKPGINDTTLNSLLCDLPSRSIALIEDIDAAFTRSINRDAPPISHPGGFDPTGDMFRGGGVTLSGLLNAIDGIYAQEGKLLLLTK